MKKIYILAAMALMTAFTACNNNQATKENTHTEDDGHNHAEMKEGEETGEHNPDEIVFTQAQAQAIGLEVQTVTSGDFHQVIRTSGKIQAAQGDEETIVATSNGIVSFVGKASVEGTAVNKGTPIVTISAKNLLEGDPMAKAKITFETAQKEYERAQNLVKDQIISAKEFEQIRLKYENARTAYKAQSANVTPGGVSVTSPISGYIKSRLVSQGEYVTVGQPIATVSQNRRLQLKADVAEKNFNQLRAITNANFVTSYDDKVYKLSDLDGRLLSFGKASDAESYYIPVTFEFNNVGNIIPGSYVDVYLLGKLEQQVIAIPASALTEEQGVNFVYLQIEPESYLKREVEVLQSDGEKVKILSGLTPGDKVVTRGAYQVKLASSSSAIPGHNH